MPRRPKRVLVNVKDWRDMTPEEFDVAAKPAPVEDEGLFPLPLRMTPPPVDPSGTGDLFAELEDDV